MRSVPFILPAVLGVVACTVPATNAPQRSASHTAAPITSAYGATEARIFDLVNAQRRAHGLAPLVYNAQLDRAAKIQAQNMAYYEKMAHVLPQANLPSPADRAHYVGYQYGRLAENVALGYPNAEAVVQGWMNSPGHRANILSGEVVETGIGVMRSKDGGLYYCQVFGRHL